MLLSSLEYNIRTLQPTPPPNPNGCRPHASACSSRLYILNGELTLAPNKIIVFNILLKTLIVFVHIETPTVVKSWRNGSVWNSVPTLRGPYEPRIRAQILLFIIFILYRIENQFVNFFFSISPEVIVNLSLNLYSITVVNACQCSILNCRHFYSMVNHIIC